MTTETAFVGDIHGNLKALHGLWGAIDDLRVRHTVFLGDYINKGAYSAAVLTELTARTTSGQATLLAGNHEHALLHALDSGNLAAFLKIGGAATIRSYVKGPVGLDVLADFRACLPLPHLEALRRMPETYETDEVVASHAPKSRPDGRYGISAHSEVGPLPRVGKHSAMIDTGCTEKSGRLTALLWPSRQFVQVDHNGVVVERERV